MFNNFSIGFSSYGKAFSFIAKHNLWIYFLYPLLIMIVLFLGGTYAIMQLSDYLRDLIMGWLGLGGTTDEGWLRTTLTWVLGIGFKIIFFFLYLSLQKYIVLILMSPVLALLSEKVDELHTGKKYPFSSDQFVRDVFRGIGIALRNMFIEFGLIFLCFLIVWLPVIGWILAVFTPVFLLFVSWYFYGFSMIDYTSERRRLTMSQSVTFIRRNKGFAIANGLVYWAIFLVPFLGVIVAPVVGVVAATLGTYDVLAKEGEAGKV